MMLTFCLMVRLVISINVLTNRLTGLKDIEVSKNVV